MATDVRYTRDEMLGIFKIQHGNGALAGDLPRVFAGPWDLSNGILHKPDSEKTGAEICWNSQPTSLPLGLEDMTEEEKQVWHRSSPHYKAPWLISFRTSPHPSIHHLN